MQDNSIIMSLNRHISRNLQIHSLNRHERRSGTVHPYSSRDEYDSFWVSVLKSIMESGSRHRRSRKNHQAMRRTSHIAPCAPAREKHATTSGSCSSSQFLSTNHAILSQRGKPPAAISPGNRENGIQWLTIAVIATGVVPPPAPSMPPRR